MSGSQHLLLGAIPQVVSDPYFEYTTLLLPGNGTNGAQNNTFLDSSTNAFSITRNGNTTQGTFSPFSQTGWSNYFDGTGDYLTAGTTSSFNFLHNSSALFTIECWVYIPSLAVSPAAFGTNSGTSSQVGTLVWIDATGIRLLIGRGSGGSPVIDATSSATVPVNQWTHIAVTYDQSQASSNAKFYINGVSSGTANKTANAPSASNSAYPGTINGFGTTGGAACYISNLRVNNSVVYASAFTPSTTPLTAIANTSLLTCQSNRFIDNSSNAFAITRNGDVSVQAFSPFNPTAAWSASTNGGSGYFDGSGDTLTIPSSTPNQFGSGDFTIECWWYFSGATVTTGQHLFFRRTTVAPIGLILGINSSKLNLLAGDSGTSTWEVDISSSTTLVPNTWYHFAATRSGSTWRIFVNGVQEASATASFTIAEEGADISMGTLITGYLSGWRALKGTAQYTGNFTVPTAPPTAIANTCLLLNFTNAGIYDATSKNDLETVGNAQISTTQSKFGGSSMYFDGTDDRLPAPASVDIAIGTADFTIEGWFYTASPATNRGLFQISTTAGGLEAGNTNNLAVYCSSSVLGVYYASTFKAGTTSISANTWTHFALVRTGGSTKLYVNGTADSGFGTNADTQNYTGKNVCVGGYFSTTYLWSGYIQDFRITRGYARYTSNFTAPTAAFPLL